MYEYLKRSEAVTHEERRKPEENKLIDTYEQDTPEIESENGVHELSSIHNAYNNVSVGADKKGSIIISAGAKKRGNSPTLNNDKKRLRVSRAKRRACHSGEFLANAHDSVSGAFAFKVDSKVPEKRMIRQIKEHSVRYGIKAVNDMMPFMSLGEDMARLSKLRGEQAPQGEIAALEQSVVQKRAEMHRFLKTLKFSKQNAKADDLTVNSVKLSENIETESADDDILKKLLIGGAVAAFSAFSEALETDNAPQDEDETSKNNDTSETKEVSHKNEEPEKG